MPRSLVGPIVLVLLLCGPALAEDDVLWNGTSRYVSLERVAEDVATVLTEDREEEKGLVVWVLDNASSLIENKVYEDLFRAIVASFGTPDGDFGEVEMGVVLFGAQPRVLCQPTDQVAEVAGAFDEAAGKADDSIKNVCEVIRNSAVHFGRMSGYRARHMVLVTLENGDNEDLLEPTVEILRRARFRFSAISREAILSDPYWSRFPQMAGGVEFDLQGADGPVQELPWGWAFQNDPAHEAVPSGYGIFGLNRMVAVTGGKYYLYYPDVPGSSYCQGQGCRLCSGRHGSCQTPFDPAKLKIFAPSVDERNRFRALMSRENYFKLALHGWETLHDEGLIQAPPPFLLEGRTVVATGKKKPSRGVMVGRVLGVQQIPALAGKARKALPEVEKLLQLIERSLRDRRVDFQHAREQAQAEMMRLHLYALRFNLKQLLHFEGYLEGLLAARGKPYPDPWSFNPVTGAPGAYVYVYVENYTFCHRRRRLENVRFLGGTTARRDLSEVLDRADKTIEMYFQTPFESVARRVGLVFFRVYEVVPRPANPANPNRPTARSNQTEQEATPETPQRQETPQRSRGGRPSRVTSGG